MMKKTKMNINKPLSKYIYLSSSLVLLAACSVETETPSSAASSAVSIPQTTTISDSSYTTTNSTAVSFEEDAITIDGSGATEADNILTITQPGTYVLSGTLTEGQVRVEAADEADVQIVLNGVSITNSTGSAIYVKSANETTITLAEGTINTLTDGESYTFEDSEDEPDATLFSKTDLVLNGAGTLVIDANYAHAIKGKDNVTIAEGTFDLTTIGDGIKGRDSLTIQSGTFNIIAGGDGLQTTNEEEEGKGYLSIESGSFSINTGGDGIQAATDLQIIGGDFALTTGGGSANGSTTTGGEPAGFPGAEESISTDDTVSAKGLKAGASLAIADGTFSLDTSDDALHTNDAITIQGGDFTLSSADDGIHADSSLTIDGGTFNIIQSYEGLESTTLTINGGEYNITASDDGINTAGGNEASSADGLTGQDTFANTATGSGSLIINGGTITVNASGDGVDSNGSIEMNSGTLVVNGPTTSGNGTLDYDTTFDMNGGILVGIGSAGMAMSPSSTSTQSFLFTTDLAIAADEAIQITGPDGEVILTFKASEVSQSLVVSTPELVEGSTYTVTSGGSVSGESSTGIYQNDVYSGGTSATDLTATTEASSNGMMGGGASPGGFMK